MKTQVIFSLLLFSTLRLFGQDSVVVKTENPDSIKIPQISTNTSYSLSYKNLIIPSVFIGYGIVSLESDGLKGLNSSTRNEINEHQPDHISLDNYTQYAPALVVYGLNAAGVKGKHNFRDRTIIYATSQLLTASFVLPIKHIVKEERPDGSNKLSFPSGHTATAFSSAHFMFKEYRSKNFLLGISGYSFAIFTGVYCTLNNKHWVNDVVAGAGFGILSTELAYWLYPKIKGLFSEKTKNSSTMVMPLYQDKGLGIGMLHSF